MSSDPTHEMFMRRAIELASGADRPFATIIVDRRQQRIVAEGWNQSNENPIWHGEIDAIGNLARANGWGDDPRQLVLYTTAEPCPMCQSAILWARIGTVVFGSSIETLSRYGWDQIGISAAEVIGQCSFHGCELIGGVLSLQCDQLYVR